MASKSAVPALVMGGAPRVNLMPRPAIERRERAAHLRRWGWGLAITLLVVALIGAAAFALQAAAEQRLAAADARTTDLLVEVAALQPVREKLSLQTELSEFRDQAMGAEVGWSDLIASIGAQLPPGISFADFTLTPGYLPVGEDPALEVGAAGSIVLTSTDPAEMVDLIRSVRQVPAVLDVDGWGQTFDEDIYRYELRIVLDQTVYTGAYSVDGGN